MHLEAKFNILHAAKAAVSKVKHAASRAKTKAQDMYRNYKEKRAEEKKKRRDSQSSSSSSSEQDDENEY